MSVLVDIKGYETKGIKIDPNGTEESMLSSMGYSLFFKETEAI